MANRLDALQSLRKSQCFSASVRTTWLYRPDTIQGLTSIRVSASRHSYGKMAATVRTMFSIRQDVHTKFNLHGPDDQALYIEIVCTNSTVRTLAFKVRTLQSLIMVITCRRSATVRTQPCYGSFRCYFEKAVAIDRPDARSSRPDALRTPSGILIITSYSNIRLGRNR
jgi:hypothetical protein